MIIARFASRLNENDFFVFLANSTKYYIGLFRGFIWINIYFADPHQLYFKLPSIQPAQQINFNVCVHVCVYEIRDRQDPVKGSGWVLSFPPRLNNPLSKWWSGICAFRNAQNSDCYFSLYNLRGPAMKWTSQHQVRQHKRS